MNVSNSASILGAVDSETLYLSRDLDSLKTNYKVNRLQWSFPVGVINRQFTRLISVAGATITPTGINRIAVASGNTSPSGAAGALHNRAVNFQKGTVLEAQFDAQFTADNFLGLQKMGFLRAEETVWFGTYFQGTICIGVETGGSNATYTITVTSASTSTHTAVASIPGLFGVNTTLNIAMVTSTGAATPVNHTAYQITTAILNAQLPGILCESFGNVIRLYYVFCLPIVGSFSITSPSVVVTQTQNTAGVFATVQLFPKSLWNQNAQITKLFDYTKPNQYKISLSNVPVGTLDFSIYNPSLKSFEIVHSIPMGNFGNYNMYNLVATAQGNPDPSTNPLGFPANLTITTSGGCVSQYPDIAPSESRIACSQSLSVASNVESPVISVRVAALLNNVITVGRLYLDTLTLAANSTQRIRFALYKAVIDPQVTYPLGAGTPTNYTDWKLQPNSLLSYDVTATTVNLSNATPILQVYLANTGTQILNLDQYNITLNTSEVLIITALGPSTPDVAVSLSFIEIY
jgi:hypothetical protein